MRISSSKSVQHFPEFPEEPSIATGSRSDTLLRRAQSGFDLDPA
jgi:hypothetical protein